MQWEPEVRNAKGELLTEGRWVAENPGAGLEPKRGPAYFPEKGGQGATVYDLNGDRMPYANSRPSHTKEFILEVWENAKDANGEVWVRDRHDNWVKIEWDEFSSRTGKWDVGHVPGEEYRFLHDKYMKREITLETFIGENKNIVNFEVQHPGRNRSGVDEMGSRRIERPDPSIRFQGVE